MAFLIVFMPLAYGAVQPWSIAVFESVAGLMALLWLLKAAKRGVIEFIPNLLILFFILFTGYVFLQLFLSQHTPYAIRNTHDAIRSLYPWATKTELLKIISYGLIFFVTFNTIKFRRQVERMLSLIIAVGFFMSLFYLMRYFNAAAPRGIINSDHFSGYLGMIISLALGLLFVRPIAAHRKPRTEQRFLLFFCVIVMSTALFFTMCRGGMFSFMAALTVMAALIVRRKSIKEKKWMILAITVFIVLAVIWLGATPIVERLLSVKAEITSRYFGGRLPIWQGLAGIIKDYPVFGTGLGTFNYIFPKYQPAEIMSRHYTYAHSDVFELLSEIGIVGFSLALLFGVWAFIRLSRHYKRRHDFWTVGLSIGFFGSITGLFIHSFVDFSLHIPAIAVLFTIIMALFFSLLSHRQAISIKLPGISYTKYAFYPLILVLAVAFIGQAVKPALADYYYRQAGAIRNTQYAIRFDPTNAAYHYHLGKFYSKLSAKAYEPSAMSHQLSAYKQAVKLNPTNSKYRQSLAWSYGQLSDSYARDKAYNARSILKKILYMNLAKKEFERAISFEPNNLYRRQTYVLWLSKHPTTQQTKQTQ